MPDTNHLLAWYKDTLGFLCPLCTIDVEATEYLEGLAFCILTVVRDNECTVTIRACIYIFHLYDDTGSINLSIACCTGIDLLQW